LSQQLDLAQDMLDVQAGTGTDVVVKETDFTNRR
jgi:adhesin HecA-like repeat protein